MSTRLVDIYAKNVNNDLRFIPSPVSKMSPVLNYEIDLDDILRLFNFSYLWIYDSQTKNLITIKNLQDYFPEYNPGGGGGGGGTSDYDQLSNKPSINDVTLTGNKTTQDLGIVENVQADWDETDSTAPSYINNKPTIPSGVAVDTTYDSTSENAQAGTAVAQAVSTKVDKVTGKGLSENDYTNADKTKLDGIEAGAEANVQSDWNQTDDTADDYIKNKPTIPDAQVNADWDAVGGVAQILNKPTIPIVDQTYNSTSTNPQSGVAIEGKKPGLKTTGIEYTIGGETIVARAGAEVFNDYTNNKASGGHSHAEGYNTTASGFYSHAEGFDTTASGMESHAEGYSTTASGMDSHAEGCDTTASGLNSHAEGSDTIASGERSHAEGISTTASGDYSHAEGYETTAASQFQHVQGKGNVADSSGTYAFIIGNGTSKYEPHNAFAIDWNGLIYVNGATTGVDVTKKPGEITTGKQYTIDGSTVTAGDGAEVFNNYTVNIASGSDSHAEGGYTRASGNYSHAEGYNTTASGSDSHAEGYGTTASSGHSHAEGYNTTASGSDSHAEGNGTTASGNYSHAEGGYTTASGNYSHAEGLGTRASEWGSHAEGRYTTAASQYQHAQGKFNVEDSSDTYAFIIGNGTSSSARHNAFAIDWNGLIYVNGATTGVDVAALAATIGDINSVLEEVL